MKHWRLPLVLPGASQTMWLSCRISSVCFKADVSFFDVLPVSWQCHTVVSDRTVSNLSPHSGIIVLMLSRLLPVSWQCHTIVSDHTVFNLSPHTGIIVLMLSRLLPVSWQCRTIVSDHTAPILSSTTRNHTTIIHLSYISTY